MKRILSAVSVLLAAILLISSALTVHAEDDPPSPPYTVLGDIDQDGEINIIDASMLQYFIAELNELSDDAVRRADANLDGGSDVLDVTHIQRFIAAFNGAYYLGLDIDKAKADKLSDEQAAKAAAEAKAKAEAEAKAAADAAKAEAARLKTNAHNARTEYRAKLKEILEKEKQAQASSLTAKKAQIDQSIKNFTKIKGVDISEFNGNVDFNKLKKAGIKFVIIRLGYGSNIYSQDDSMFEANVKKAEAAGMPWGAYIYSYALNTTSAKSEVQHTLRLLKGKKPTMPIAFDIEEDDYKDSNGMTNKALHDVTATYLKGIADAGYYPILYTGYDWLTGPFNTKDIVGTYDIWYAQWYTVMQYNTSRVGIWQYGGEVNYLESPYISGLSGAYDKDYCFKNYPVLIPNYGYNNHAGLFDKKLAPTAADYSDEDLYTESGEKVPDGFNGVMGDSFRKQFRK